MMTDKSQALTASGRVKKTGINETLRYWGFLCRKNLRKVFSSCATPKSIATGAAVGFFITMLPIQGFQMISALPVCRLFRGNYFSAIGPIWLSNPITLPFFYYISFVLGAFVTGYSASLDYAFFSSVALDNIFVKLQQILVPLVVGSLILAVFLAAVAYPVFYMIALHIKKRRQSKTRRWRILAKTAALKQRLSGKLNVAKPVVQVATVKNNNA
ncbi:MAG: DUF2062 domain-containing protein [Planctomycetota bacterium]|nr:DUF2062 domain-containing protein [Planctomycetota bacterium]